MSEMERNEINLDEDKELSVEDLEQVAGGAEFEQEPGVEIGETEGKTRDIKID
jgi:hypothetical protein